MCRQNHWFILRAFTRTAWSGSLSTHRPSFEDSAERTNQPVIKDSASGIRNFAAQPGTADSEPMYRKFREVWICNFWDMWADRQTHRHTDTIAYFAPLPGNKLGVWTLGLNIIEYGRMTFDESNSTVTECYSISLSNIIFYDCRLTVDDVIYS